MLSKLSPCSLKKAVASFVSLICLTTMLPARAFAWSEDGHKTVALVGYKLLTPRAKKNVDAILQGETVDGVVMWPDDLKRAGAGCTTPDSRGCNENYRPETAQWHFVDMPYEALKYRKTLHCPSSRYGDCVVVAVEEFQAILSKSTGRSFAKYGDEQKRKYHDALRFMLHLVGDAHQPLHCAERNHDGGGNSVLVTWQGEPKYKYDVVWNLHSVWDEYIVDRDIARMNRKGFADYSDLLVSTLTPQQKAYAQLRSTFIKPRQPETVVSWAEGSHLLARSFAYDLLPQQTVKKSFRGEQKLSKGAPQDLIVLDENYFNRNMPVVQQQIQLGGVRLARLLNEIFDKDIPD